MTASSAANSLQTLFTQFNREHQFINNRSAKTLRFYRCCFDSLKSQLKRQLQLSNAMSANAAADTVNNMNPADLTGEVLTTYVEALAGSGIKPVSIASYVRGLNCFLVWLERKGHITQSLRLPCPRFELELPRTLNQSEIAALVQLKPRSRTMRRVHAIALVCLDTGCRVKEVLGLRFNDVDLDAMVLRVLGKGRRERLVPFSPELRKVLFRWIESEKGKNRMVHNGTALLFATRDGLGLRYDNLRRDYRKLLSHAGIDNPGGFHKLRHTFATEFIRSGRGEILLSRILGHTTLDMTRRYVQSNVEDLRGCSPLTSARAFRG